MQQLSKKDSWRGVIREYRDFLPPVKEEAITTLLEGNTPLIEAVNLKAVFGDIRLLFKYEGLNPTCSFKDRGMTMAVSKAREEGSRAVICASTGNTSAAAAAYAARAGMKAYVLVPEGGVALGKLSQAIMHGAAVFQIKGTFDELLEIVKEVTANYPVSLVNSLNPFRIEGQKTGAFEVCEHLGHAPTFHFLPVGNAGNITAYWKGYKEYEKEGFIANLPKMMGFQAEGAAPIVLGHPVDNPETLATAIKIGNPASWKGAEKARDESGGVIEAVSDTEILDAYKLIASREGVFCEPASAASVAGAIKKKKEGILNDGDTVVCTLTGHGLKDPDRALATSEEPLNVAADIKEIVKVMGL
ncbi:MAG: threonine synthase [Thermodesulfobacteriota bacterium]|nr:MAG: threonine synthase [Thermodesulfobacteriota bacterium]